MPDTEASQSDLADAKIYTYVVAVEEPDADREERWFVVGVHEDEGQNEVWYRKTPDASPPKALIKRRRFVISPPGFGSTLDHLPSMPIKLLRFGRRRRPAGQVHLDIGDGRRGDHGKYRRRAQQSTPTPTVTTAHVQLFIDYRRMSCRCPGRTSEFI